MTMDGFTPAAAHRSKNSEKFISRVPFVQLRNVDSDRPSFSARDASVCPFSFASFLNLGPHVFHVFFGILQWYRPGASVSDTRGIDFCQRAAIPYVSCKLIN